MNPIKPIISAVCLWGILLWPGTSVSAEINDWVDRVDESLYVASPGGYFRSDASALLDLETYYVDQQGPGLIFGDESFFGPRLSLYLDTKLGPHFYSLLQARFDRGFDPRFKKQDGRLDEYLIRYKPFEDSRIHFQFGKFATVFGNWVRRHSSWDNPFINAPVPYENVTIVTDQIAPRNTEEFLNRRSVADQKAKWLPVIWGPSYATGWSAFGALEKLDYAFELKNASVSSRPAFWRASQLRWETPTVSGRLGYRPNAAWDLGSSFSLGGYLHPKAGSNLRPDKEIGDYLQVTLGPDFSYAWRHWQFWAEVFWSRFEVPNVGDADTGMYYLEAKYKLTPRFFLAARWNQQFFSKIDDGRGGRKRWDRDLFRIDAALGCRLSRHLQAKLQYDYGHQKGDLQQGENLLAVQVTFKI